jgi:hypothetical protein
MMVVAAADGRVVIMAVDTAAKVVVNVVSIVVTGVTETATRIR